MYYLVKVDGKWKSIHYGGTYSDAIIGLLKQCGVEVSGQFGRKDYCDFYRDRYNNESSQVREEA